MESCQFEALIQPSRNGFESVYRSWEEQRESGPNVPVHHPHSELYSRSTVTAANSYPYTACPQTIDNLSWTKDSTSNCSYTNSNNQNRIHLSHSILPVRGTAPSAILDGNFPHHQPVNSIHGLHRAPPTSVQASVHGSAFTQSVPRTATKWPPPCAMATHYSGHAESEPNNAIHRSPCTGEWQYSSQQSGCPTYTSTTEYLNGLGAPARSSSMHEIRKGRKTSNCMISNSPCGACGNILCPENHPMCPNELTVACPRSPPCSGLNFPAYATRPAPPTPAVAAPRSEALVEYGGWPASAPPLCFYGKLVSAGKKRDFPGNRGVTESPNVGRGPGTNETVNSTIQVSVNGHRDSEPTKLLTYYHNKGSNLCNICGRSYARPSTLKTHLRTHSGEKPYRCRTCGKAFSQTANLTAHMRTHSGEKPFLCTLCHRQFSQSSSVTTHMRTHSGERPYRCAYCKKAFADSSTLTKHLRIHSGDRPYECRTCLLRFSQSGNLTRHMKVHEHLREDCFGTN